MSEINLKTGKHKHHPKRKTIREALKSSQESISSNPLYSLELEKMIIENEELPIKEEHEEIPATIANEIKDKHESKKKGGVSCEESKESWERGSFSEKAKPNHSKSQMIIEASREKSTWEFFNGLFDEISSEINEALSRIRLDCWSYLFDKDELPSRSEEIQKRLKEKSRTLLRKFNNDASDFSVFFKKLFESPSGFSLSPSDSSQLFHFPNIPSLSKKEPHSSSVYGFPSLNNSAFSSPKPSAFSLSSNVIGTGFSNFKKHLRIKVGALICYWGRGLTLRAKRPVTTMKNDNLSFNAANEKIDLELLESIEKSTQHGVISKENDSLDGFACFVQDGTLSIAESFSVPFLDNKTQFPAISGRFLQYSSVVVSPNGKMLLVSDFYSRRISLVSWRDLKTLHTWHVAHSPSRMVWINNEEFVVGFNQGTVLGFHKMNSKAIDQYPCFGSVVLAICPLSDSVVCGDGKGEIFRARANNQAILWSMRFEESKGIHAIASFSSEFVLACGDLCTMNLHRVATGEIVENFSRYSGFSAAIRMLIVSPNSEFIIGGSDNEILLLKINEEKLEEKGRLTRREHFKGCSLRGLDVDWERRRAVIGAVPSDIYTVEINIE